MSDIQETRRSNLTAWVEANGGHAKVVEAFRLKTSRASYLSQCVNGYSMGEKAARNWELAFRLPAGFLDRAVSALQVHDAREVAHVLSQLSTETVSPMSWEQLMSEDPKGALPKKFSFPMPDESMAPRVRQGAVIVMDSTLEAKVGDGVLVRDSSGTLHFRQYRAGRPGVWEAYAFNETYRALESDRDGLTVLAVKVALEDRGL